MWIWNPTGADPALHVTLIPKVVICIRSLWKGWKLYFYKNNWVLQNWLWISISNTQIQVTYNTQWFAKIEGSPVDRATQYQTPPHHRRKEHQWVLLETPEVSPGARWSLLPDPEMGTQMTAAFQQSTHASWVTPRLLLSRISPTLTYPTQNESIYYGNSTHCLWCWIV